MILAKVSPKSRSSNGKSSRDNELRSLIHYAKFKVIRARMSGFVLGLGWKVELIRDNNRVELTSPRSGWVDEILVREGESVNVGQTLCEIRDQEVVEMEDDAARPRSSTHDAANILEVSHLEGDRRQGIEMAASPAEEGVETKQVDNAGGPDVEFKEGSTAVLDESLLSIPDTAMDQAGGARFSGEASSLPSPPPQSAPPNPSSSGTPFFPSSQLDPSPENETPPRHPVKASPAVRNLASRLKVDLTILAPTGEAGRVTWNDVMDANMAKEMPSPRIGQSSRDTHDEITRVEFGRTRKAMYKALGPQAGIPHFGYVRFLLIQTELILSKLFSYTESHPSTSVSPITPDQPPKITIPCF
jgi:2-oxoisovalerate dehydrogenase E2 component (dihydrolipoyl transacylase)